MALEREPVYDVKNSTGVYASMAGTLSGFAFTAIVLLLRELPPDCVADPDCSRLRQRALVALVIAFIGCGISGFAFAVVAAEGDHRRRLRAAFFAGNAFIVSLGHLLWAVAVLAKLFLPPTGDPTQVRVALGVSLGTIGVFTIAPLFLLLAARAFEFVWLRAQADARPAQGSIAPRSHGKAAPAVTSKPPIPTPRDPRTRLWSFWPVPVLLIVAVALWAIDGSRLTVWAPERFDALSLLAGVFVIAMVTATLRSVMRREDWRAWFIQGSETDRPISPGPGPPRTSPEVGSRRSTDSSMPHASSCSGVAWTPVVGTMLILCTLIVLLPK